MDDTIRPSLGIGDVVPTINQATGERADLHVVGCDPDGDILARDEYGRVQTVFGCSYRPPSTYL